MNHGDANPPAPGPDGPSAPSSWAMTWSQAVPDDTPIEESSKEEPVAAAQVTADDTESRRDLFDDLPGLQLPARPRRPRLLPQPMPGPALTTLFVAALSILLIAISLVWPAVTR